MAELTNSDIGDLLGSLRSIAEELGCIHIFLQRIAEAMEDPEREVVHKIKLTVEED